MSYVLNSYLVTYLLTTATRPKLTGSSCLCGIIS